MDKGSSLYRLTALIILILCADGFCAQDTLYSYGSDNGAVFEKFASSAPKLVIGTKGIRSAIVPHHLLAGAQLSGFFRTLAAAAPGTRRIVILGPDHFLEEIPLIILNDLPWKTPFGKVSCDGPANALLLKEMPEAKIISTVHNKEHSISSIVPFVSEFFPGASVTAIVVKPYLDRERAEALGDVIAKLPSDTLVILSTDFVHYKNRKETEAIDAENEKLIQKQFAAYDPAETLRIDADCRKGILALFCFNRKVKADKAEKILYSNSHTITGRDEPGTSYFFYVFGKE